MVLGGFENDADDSNLPDFFKVRFFFLFNLGLTLVFHVFRGVD